MSNEKKAYEALKESMEAYSPISDETWRKLLTITSYRLIPKNNLLYKAGETPKSYAFVYQGLLRCYSSDEKGTEYNKNFFDEGKFPGSMSSLLTSTPSLLTFEAIENTFIIEINFSFYRKLLIEKEDLKLFHIYYLEKNWLLAKDSREIELVQEDATSRYVRFTQEYPSLTTRLPQYHIASHLGITPTQLSRIRKNL
jgi:CRP-like cAMP-binding protein